MDAVEWVDGQLARVEVWRAAAQRERETHLRRLVQLDRSIARSDSLRDRLLDERIRAAPPAAPPTS